MYEGLVKSLRWLGFMFPETHPAQDDADRMSNNIHLYCTQAADAIEELTDNNVGKWIPVTERLPEKNGSYLVYVYGEVTEMDCWHGKWHRLRDDYTKAVTHWMPLPEPPKEET